mgnify:CR=1 FL=1
MVTSISALGKASIRFKQSVYLESTYHADESVNSSSGLLSEADIKIACLNAKKFTAQSIPASIIKKINQEFLCGS